MSVWIDRENRRPGRADSIAVCRLCHNRSCKEPNASTTLEIFVLQRPKFRPVSGPIFPVGPAGRSCAVRSYSP